MPKEMLYLVAILLLGQVFGALQFGPLYRHPKLDRVVMTESHTLIDISAQGYGAMLQLEDAGLKVPSVYGMNILVIPKQGKMKTPDTNNVIKVRQDDIIIIYSGAKFQRNRYNSTSAENLKTLVENDASALVFGVVIQNTPSPVINGVATPSTYGFADFSMQNVDDNHMTSLLLSSSLIVTKEDVPRLWVLVGTNGLEVTLEEGGVGALLRNGKVIKRFDFDRESTPFKPGDVILIMLPKKQKASLPLNHAMSLVQQGRRRLLGKTFPNVMFFVATIVDTIPNYLEDVVVIGEGSVDCGVFYRQTHCRSAWWFEGNTMRGVIQPAGILHISQEEIKDNVDELAAKVGEMEIEDDEIQFRIEPFKITHLKPRDIVCIITKEENTETVGVSAIKRALADCKTSADLKTALKGLKFHPNTTAMAAFVSDKIPPSKLEMTGLTTNEPADAAYAKTLATWIKSEKEINVSLPNGNASAAIVFTDRNKISIRQMGGAVALIIDKDGGLKHGPKMAFGNTHRPIHLELGLGVANHDNLEVEHGDTAMVILPLSFGGIKWKPFEIAATAHDFDIMEEHLELYLPEGQTAVIAARIERTK